MSEKHEEGGMEYAETVLIVDDDENLLSGIRRQLRNRFNMLFACGGQEAIALLREDRSVAVVVSDMSMPRMNGVELLSRIAKARPGIVRIMLTGNADLDTPIEAVNRGGIYRFLLKPCDDESLAIAIRAGIDQYRLIRAERELLEKTLAGSVRVLSDMLALVNPAAFSRASRTKKYCSQIIAALERKHAWRFELMAMLSQIGCVALPPEILTMVDAGEDLDPEKRKMYARHPSLGRELLSKIPRLREVAVAIGDQQRPYCDFATPELADDGVFGAMLLKATIDFDTLISGGSNHARAMKVMRERLGHYEPSILEALARASVVEVEWESRVVPILQLKPDMILADDLRTGSGLLLAKKGQEVTPSMKVRLENFLANREIPGEILVMVQASQGCRPEELPEPTAS